MVDLKSTTIEDNYPDENAPRHRCCCNNVHVILGAKIMATLGIVLYFLAISLNVYNLHVIGASAIFANKQLTFASVVLDDIEILATFLVFRALAKRREVFLIPILVVLCLNMVRLLAAFVVDVVNIRQSSTDVEECRRDPQTDLAAEYLACPQAVDCNYVVIYLAYIMLIVGSISGAVYLIWPFSVYFHCYQFLKAKNQWIRSNQLALRDSQVQPDSLENSPPPVSRKPCRRL